MVAWWLPVGGGIFTGAGGLDADEGGVEEGPGLVTGEGAGLGDALAAAYGGGLAVTGAGEGGLRGLATGGAFAGGAVLTVLF